MKVSVICVALHVIRGEMCLSHPANRLSPFREVSGDLLVAM
jgi:hypothetical protein